MMSRKSMVALLLATAVGIACARSTDEWLWTRRDLNPVTLEGVAGAKPLAIVQDGVAKAVLIVPTAREDFVIKAIPYVGQGPVKWVPTGAAAFAAREIAKYVEKTTGAKLAITDATERVPSGMIPIYVGFSSAAKAAGFTQEGLSGEGFRMTNDGQAIAVIGAPKGTHNAIDGEGAPVFAAYDFLERFVGVRFYYHGEQGVSVEPRQTIVIPPVTYADFPRFDHRYAYAFRWDDQKDNCSIVTALRFRSGGNGWGAENVLQHSPDNLAAILEKDCLQVNEKGEPTGTLPPMPCYGNPKTLDKLMEAYAGWYARSPVTKTVWKVGEKPSAHAIGFCPPDHQIDCHCDFCQKFPPRLDLPYWEQQSEVIGDFVRRLSWRVKEAYPDKRLYHLAYYNYSTPPAKPDFADNLYVRLCFMYGESTYLDPYIRSQYRKWVDGWIRATHGHRISGYLYRWPGTLEHIGVPFQCHHAYKAFFTDLQGKCTGFFEGISGPKVKAISDYCLMRLEWNPAFDVDAAVNEMYRRLFGPAAAEMGAIYDRFTRAFEEIRVPEFKNLYKGGPYWAPHMLPKETFETFAREEIVNAAVDDLKAAKAKVATADSIYRDRVAYFGGPVELLAKKLDFYKRGGIAAERSIIAQRTQSADITIDGRLDEAAWKAAMPSDLVPTMMAIGVETPDQPVDVRVLQAEDGLYVGMRMREPKMKERYLGANDNEVYRNDGVEITFDALTDGKRVSGNFAQHYISSDGRMLYGNNIRLRTAKEANIRIAWHYVDNGWSVELFAPYAEILRATPKEKWADVKKIKANFHRYHRYANGYRFNASWRTNFKGNNRDTSTFGDIVLPDPIRVK